MKIIFRADGNREIGAGHLMRCLSIAEAAKEKGLEACFITARDTFSEIIKKRGIPYKSLGSSYKDLEDELPELRTMLAEQKAEYLVIDSYYVTFNYLGELKKYIKTIYMDDRAAFAYPADVLINYNLYAQDLDYRKIYKEAGTMEPRMLLGTKYVPLRKEFQGLSQGIVKEKVSNVFVSTGGADAEHITIKMVQYLIENRTGRSLEDEIRYHFVIGSMNQDAGEIAALAQGCPQVIIHENVSNMKELMRSCEMAVSAAGSTMYELCACSMPIITYVLADNQKMIAETFDSLGAAVSAADYRYKKDFIRELFHVVDKLKEDYRGRLSLAERAFRLVDGNGAGNIIESVGLLQKRL